MKKYIGLLFISLILFFACAGKPVSEPLWLSDLNSVYPEKDYFAKTGTGASSEEAVLNAMTELASYFSTSVSNVVESKNSFMELDDGSVEKNRSVQVHSVSATDLDFFALEKAEPYFSKTERKWYALAFINREKAWNQYEPTVRDSMNAFYSVYNLSLKDSDPLRRIKIYREAQIEGQKFISDLYKAQILSKERTEKNFGEARRLYSSIPGLIQNEKSRCVLYFELNEDYSGILKSTLNQVFSKIAFPVTETKSYSFYRVQVKLDYNRQDEEDLIVMNPSINLIFTNESEVLYTYDAVLEKVISYNLSKAQKNVCTNAAEILNKELGDDFVYKTGIVR